MGFVPSGYLPMLRLIFALLLAVAATAAFAQRIDVNLQDERQRDSYMVGMDTVTGLTKIKDRIDIRIVAQTVIDLLVDGEKPLLSQDDYVTTRKAFVAKIQADKKK